MEFALNLIPNSDGKISIYSSNSVVMGIKHNGAFFQAPISIPLRNLVKQTQENHLIHVFNKIKKSINKVLDNMYSKQRILDKKIILIHTVLKEKEHITLTISLCSKERFETRSIRVENKIKTIDFVREKVTNALVNIFNSFFRKEKEEKELKSKKLIRSSDSEQIREARRKQIRSKIEKYKLTEKQIQVLKYAYYARAGDVQESPSDRGFFIRKQMPDKYHHDIFNLLVGKKLLSRGKIGNEYKYKITQLGIDIIDMMKLL